MYLYDWDLWLQSYGEIGDINMSCRNENSRKYSMENRKCLVIYLGRNGWDPHTYILHEGIQRGEFCLYTLLYRSYEPTHEVLYKWSHSLYFTLWIVFLPTSLHVFVANIRYLCLHGFDLKQLACTNGFSVWDEGKQNTIMEKRERYILSFICGRG